MRRRAAEKAYSSAASETPRTSHGSAPRGAARHFWLPMNMSWGLGVDIGTHVLASSAVGTPGRLRFATISVEGYLRSSRSRKLAFPSDEWIRHGRGTRNDCHTSNESQSDADCARDLGDRRVDVGWKR